MTDSDQARRTFRASLLEFVGRSSGPPRLAKEHVNEPMIRQWCTAMGDQNPAYLDAAVAARTPFAGIVAPPTMLQSWTHPDRRFVQSSDDDAEEQLGRTLVAAGYTGVVATRCRSQLARYLRVNDRTSYESRIDAVSELKQTALGEGYFITRSNTYRDQHDEIVGTIESTTLRYRPADIESGGGKAASLSTAPATPIERSGPVAHVNALEAGQVLPSARFEITTTLIVCGALASCDYFAAHHDAATARSLGQPNIFMNIMTSQGLISRYLTDWSGPNAMLRGLDIHLGIANRPGDTMVVEGTVETIDSEPGGHVATISVSGTISRGRHINAVARLFLPDQATLPPSRQP